VYRSHALVEVGRIAIAARLGAGYRLDHDLEALC
jgi:hypothetical protein